MLNKFGKRKKKNELDKFYTKPHVSKSLVEKLFGLYNLEDFDVILEPSVGSGSFFFHLPEDKREGADIEPAVEDSKISQIDFFDWEPQTDKKYIVVGNPPFGRISSLAVKFFQKSTEFAEVIAFLVPRTFRRVSVQNKLSLDFHLVYDEEMPLKPCCFEPEMSVKCCFQIWEKRDVKRKKTVLTKACKDWEFLSFGPLDDNGQPTPPDGASFVLRAYGGKCGEIVSDGLESLRPKSWHWIKCKEPQILKNRFVTLDYSISKDTARQNSIGRAELVWLYKQKYKEGELDEK